MSGKLIVNSPWYFFAISAVIAFCIAVFLYWRNNKNTEAPRWSVRSLFMIRFIAVFLILFLLLNILLRKLTAETENPLVLIALDNSSSIAASSDSLSVQDFLKSVDGLAENIGSKYTVKRLIFGALTRNAGDPPDFSDKETDISELLSTVENNYGNQNIGALIIASDGIYNKGSNPAYLTEKLNYPVYTIALGDTNEIRDVILQKVEHNEVAYLGNNFPVEIMVRARKYAGRTVAVELFENGVNKGRQELKIGGDNFSGTTNFTLNAGTPGVARFTARVSALEGEKNRGNNTQSFAIEVIDNREKVLLLAEAPHPDVAAIKNAIEESSSYDVSYSLTGAFSAPLKGYSLVILHGVGAAMAKWSQACTAARVPLWVINPQTAENIPGLRVNTNFSRFNDVESFTDKNFSLFNPSAELRKFISAAPALKTFFGTFSYAKGSSALIQQRIGNVETDNPVLLFSESEGTKNAVFAADGLWKWRLRDYAEHQNFSLFNELISKCVQYLSVRSDKSFFRLRAPRLLPENEVLVMEAEVYNKAYEPVTDPDVTLILTNEEKKRFNYAFGKNNNGYKLELGMLPPGDYKYEATVQVNNETYRKTGVISVKEVVAEKLNTVADHQLLHQLSSRSSGKLYYPSGIGKLRDEIIANQYIRPVTYSQTSTVEIIELRWLFWLIILLFTVEWFFRKRYLTI